MKQKWKPTQYIEISIDELFAFQDKLDAVEENPERVWSVVDEFFNRCEDELELDPDFIKGLKEIDFEDNIIDLNDIDSITDIDSELLSPLQVIKAYQEYQKEKHDIPFTPRIGF